MNVSPEINLSRLNNNHYNGSVFDEKMLQEK